MIKKILYSPWTSLLTLVVVLSIRVSDPNFVESVRLRYFDSLINSKPVTTNNIYTVNIDEDTLSKYGQWPFNRKIYADIIQQIYSHNAGLVVFNVLMSETDRQGGDITLSELLKSAPVILPSIPAEITKNAPRNPGSAVLGPEYLDRVIQYPGIIANIPVLENNAAGIGIVNTLPEIDGVNRRMPLVVSYNEKLYPSLSLETLRVAAGDTTFQIKLSELGVEKLRIPSFGPIITDNLGRIWIDWSHRSRFFSFTELPESFNGKIVIVGVTGRGLNNPVATAVGEQYPHDLQGAILDTIISGSNISRPDWSTIAEIGVTILLSIISILLVRWKYGFIPVLFIISGVYFACGSIFDIYKFLIDCTTPILGISVVFAHCFVTKFITELNAKLQIKKQFGTYLSPALVEKLQKNPELLRLGGERRQLSIMFTDVRGFTSISEHYGDNVEGLTSIMNRYMTAMTAAIIKNNGTLDKYIGDAQMAFWNAPLDEPYHAKLAVKTALEMLGSLDAFNKEIAVEGVPAFGMGLGINTADVVVGNMGSVQRFDYTCLGDGVNLASRLEGQSKPYGVGIIIGSITAQQIQDEYFTLKLDKIAVKGKAVGVDIYTVIPENSSQSVEYRLMKQKHDMMLDLYRKQQWKDSAMLCHELIGEFGGAMDKYYKMMIERICQYEM